MEIASRWYAGAATTIAPETRARERRQIDGRYSIEVFLRERGLIVPVRRCVFSMQPEVSLDFSSITLDFNRSDNGLVSCTSPLESI
jgi:hypothetical protein